MTLDVLDKLAGARCGKNQGVHICVSGCPPFRGSIAAGHTKYNHGWTDVPGHSSLRGPPTAGQIAVPGYPSLRGVTAAGHQRGVKYVRLGL